MWLGAVQPEPEGEHILLTGREALDGASQLLVDRVPEHACGGALVLVRRQNLGQTPISLFSDRRIQRHRVDDALEQVGKLVFAHAGGMCQLSTTGLPT